jgi:ribosomal protein S18 acetylase RimI-like enzyme
MRFRPAIPADVPHLIPMLLDQYSIHVAWDASKFAPVPGFEKGYAQWLARRADDPESVFLVATAGDADDAPPVGFLIGTVEDNIPIYRTPRYGYIHDLYVLTPYRNEGTARQLVTLALEKFRELGMTQVRCETAVQNPAAHALFEKCTFRKSAIEMLAEI